MAEQGSSTGDSTAPAAVRAALRAELTSRGHRVASDTLGTRPDIYIVAPDDLAKALFHFGDDAGEVAMAMYWTSGNWAAGMPPRFAVLPADQSESPSLEMLEQMRTVPLFYEIEGDRVAFRDLDRLLAEHVGS